MLQAGYAFIFLIVLARMRTSKLKAQQGFFFGLAAGEQPQMVDFSVPQATEGQETVFYHRMYAASEKVDCILIITSI